MPKSTKKSPAGKRTSVKDLPKKGKTLSKKDLKKVKGGVGYDLKTNLKI
jgi:bacteriocin-like protein